MDKTVFEYIKSEEQSYKTTPIPLTDGWDWSMYEHIRRSYLYKYSKYWKGANDGNRPFKNLVMPLLNLQYRTEGFRVKEVIPYVDSKDDYHKSFLVKKYHGKYALENKINKSVKESVMSYADYGLMLLKKTKNKAPEVVPLQRLAFCDQTDILAGAICEKHPFSIDQLRDKAGAWDADKIETLILQAQNEKETQAQGQRAKTPNKYIEVYELHGVFPETWLNENGNPTKAVRQMHIVGYYKDKKGDKQGVTLFKGKESKSIYKALKRGDIFGRACGFGGVEELFEHQTWANYSEIRIKEMLDAAAVQVIKTTDEGFANRNNLGGRTLETNEVLTLAEGTDANILNNPSVNLEKFNNNVIAWNESARVMASASDSALAENPKSGTPFALERLVTAEGKGLHEDRKDDITDFWTEVYKEWILPDLVREINQGQEFLEELSFDELNEVVDSVVENEINSRFKKQLIEGDSVPSEEERNILRDTLRDNFLNRKGKKVLKLVKDEIKDIPVDVEISISNKQKDLSKLTSDLVNVFRQVISAPQILQDKGVADLFNQIIESAGLNPVMFSGFREAVAEQPPANKTQNNLPVENLTQ